MPSPAASAGRGVAIASAAASVLTAMKPKKSSPQVAPLLQRRNWSASTSSSSLSATERHDTGRVASAAPKPVAKKNSTGAKLPRKTSAPETPLVAACGVSAA